MTKDNHLLGKYVCVDSVTNMKMTTLIYLYRKIRLEQHPPCSSWSSPD
jgi:hypothetical protein